MNPSAPSSSTAAEPVDVAQRVRRTDGRPPRERGHAEPMTSGGKKLQCQFEYWTSIVLTHVPSSDATPALTVRMPTAQASRGPCRRSR